MVTKEIKEFIISQMKEADWSHNKYSDNWDKYSSKYIKIDWNYSGAIFSLNMDNRDWDTYQITRKELGLNFFYFLWLIRFVRKSSKLYEKRFRNEEISKNWNKFIEKNKEIIRDHKIKKIID